MNHIEIQEQAETIKSRRIALGLKQKGLALEAGISANDMSRVECAWPRGGHFGIVISTLDRLELEGTQAGRIDDWLDGVNAHVDAGGTLTHKNGLELLKELNRLKGHS